MTKEYMIFDAESEAEDIADEIFAKLELEDDRRQSVSLIDRWAMDDAPVRILQESEDE